MRQRIWTLIAAVLLCLTLLTTSLTCGMYARYTTSGTGTERARVAKFGQLSLTLADAPQDKILLPNVDGDGATVTLNPKVSMTASEVAVVVYVEVTLPEDSGWRYDQNQRSFNCGPILWTVADDWVYLPDSEAETEKVYTFYRTLAPGKALTEERFVDGGTMNVPPNYDDYYSLTNADVNLNIQFKARAAQID